jgi:hypothetical protein
MKKYIFVAVLALFAFNSAQAQVSQGRVMVGGNFGLNQNSGGNGTSTSLSFNPSVGFFITDNIALGAGLIATSNSTTQTFLNTTTRNSTTAIGLAPFARYYGEIVEKFYWFGNGGIAISSASTRTTVNNTTTVGPANTLFQFNLGGGLAFFPSEKFQVEMAYNVLSFQSVGDGGSSVGFGLNTFAPSFGFRFFF